MRQTIAAMSFQSDFPKRILVTGGHGMLGNSFFTSLKKMHPDCEVLALGREQLDVRKRDDVLKFQDWIKNGWIIHCAALVNVEGCARNPVLARETIVDGTKNVVELAKLANAGLLYPQSFLVFDGSDCPIPENEQPRPLSLYGQLKFEAETYVQQNLEKSLCVRMAGFFGGQQRDKNFVGKIIQQIAQKIDQGETQIAIGDRVWQPTWTDDLAMNSIVLIGAGKTGTYQMASNGTASFYELTQEIAKNLKWSQIEILKVSATSVTSDELGRRPNRAELSCQRLHEEGLNVQRPWADALKEYLADSYFDQYRNLSGRNTKMEMR